jgi:hypothetical protein|tara:strand:+ start:249 stop:422 length:174 start_codon:yes stop_codon:yes gene_type:complete
MTHGHTLTDMLRQQWVMMKTMVDTEVARSGDLPRSALRVLGDRVDEKLAEFDRESVR